MNARRARRIQRWQAMTGARPAWIVSFALALGTLMCTEWLSLRERVGQHETRIERTERDVQAEGERIRAMIRRRCPLECRLHEP